tara:strand:- start:1702 stop:2223 length:522 start_codon:yes stop_codon:yes gene_type:complete
MKFFFALFFLVCTVYALFVGLSKDPREVPSMLINQQIPNFESLLIPSKKYFDSESLMTDEVKIVNFFASWCPPCKIEHPQLMFLNQKNKVKIFGVLKKDNHDNLENFLRSLGNPYHAIIDDPKGKTGISWGVYGLPETFIVDKKGKIRYKHIGPIMKREVPNIQKIIDELHNE